MNAAIEQAPLPPIESVWGVVTPALRDELVAFWLAHGAFADAAQARVRAQQAVLVARDADGAVCAVGTAVVRVLPRLRQPMYYYRQFFAPSVRGQGWSYGFISAARRILETANAARPTPEALGLLLEIESPLLARRMACAQEYEFTFIGYSPRGLQLRVAYFAGARLLPPAPVRATAA